MVEDIIAGAYAFMILPVVFTSLKYVYLRLEHERLAFRDTAGILG